MSDAQNIMLTPDEALALMWDNGTDVHVYNAHVRISFGATWDKDEATKAIKEAVEISLGNFSHHRIVVRQPSGRIYLFETDDEKVDNFLKSKATSA